jgi:hypothetical protein
MTRDGDSNYRRWVMGKGVSATKNSKKKYLTFVLFVSFVVNVFVVSLLTALVQTKRRFEEESVNLHVNRIVDAHANDATDLLGDRK